MFRGKTGGAERESHDQAREAFADARNGIHRARRELADHREPLDQFIEPVEVGANVAVEIGGDSTGQR